SARPSLRAAASKRASADSYTLYSSCKANTPRTSERFLPPQDQANLRLRATVAHQKIGGDIGHCQYTNQDYGAQGKEWKWRGTGNGLYWLRRGERGARQILRSEGAPDGRNRDARRRVPPIN